MADEQYQPTIKDKYVAAEIKRRQQLLITHGYKGPEDKPLESDITFNNIVTAVSWWFFPEMMAGSAIFRHIVQHIVPTHPGLQFLADLLGGIGGAVIGDPATREMFVEKYGEALGKSISPKIAEGLKEIIGQSKEAIGGTVGETAKAGKELGTILIDTVKEMLGIKDIMSEAPKETNKVTEAVTKEGAEAVAEQMSRFEKSLKELEPYYKKDLKSYGERALKASGKKEVAVKIKQFDKVYKATGRVYDAMYDAQLYNPRIGLTKLGTDAVFLPMQIAFRSLGAGIEHGAAAGVKTLTAALYSYSESFMEALKYAVQTYAEDRPVFQEDVLKLGEKAVFGLENPESFLESPTAKAYRWIYQLMSPGRRFVMSADQFAKTIAHRANERMAAYMIALDEAEKLDLVGAAKIYYADNRSETLLNTDNEIIQNRAKMKMFEDTFTDQSKLIKTLTRFIDQVPGARLLVPYLRTPAALIKQGISVSPFAPLSSASRNLISPGGGPFGNIDDDVAIAKWAAGTALWGWIGRQVAKGNIAGSGPGNSKLRDVWPGKNHPRSMKLGDEFFGFRHLGPFGVTLGMAADYAEVMGQADGFSQENLVDAMGSMFARQIESMPFLESMANVMHAFDSIKEGQTGKAASEFLGQEISGFIPAPVRITASIEDPIVRKAQGVLDEIKRDIPGWTEQVPPKRDRFGHLIIPSVGHGIDTSATKPERLLNSMNPIPIEGDTNIDPVDKELYKYGIGFTPIPDHVGDSAVSVKLHPVEQSDWERYSGHELEFPTGDGTNKNQHDYLNHVINQDYYKKAPPLMQKQILDHVSGMFRDAGKNKMMQQYPRIQMEIFKTHAEMMQTNEQQGENK